MAVGQIVGVAKKSHVPQLGKIKTGEIVMGAASLVMSYVKMTIHRRRHITRLQFRQVSAAPSLAVMAGVWVAIF